MRFTNLLSYFFITNVVFSTESVEQQFVHKLLCVACGSFSQADNLNLNGRHPKRECACILFNKHCKGTFVTTDRASMNNIRQLLFTVFVNVVHTETLSRTKVDLNCDKSIFFSMNVFGLNVKLRTIEGCFAVCFYVF